MVGKLIEERKVPVSGRWTLHGLEPGAREVEISAVADDGAKTEFTALVRVDTPKEWEYYNNGGILHYVLRELAA